MGLGIAVVVVIVLVVALAIACALIGNSREKEVPQVLAHARDECEPQAIKETPPNVQPQVDHNAEDLRRKLRLILLGDEERVNRLIEAERKLNPTAAEHVLLESAIDRWQKDNRSWR